MTGFVLASGSAIRRKILTQAGVAFTIQRAQVDEGELKKKAGDMAAPDLALHLAEAKAMDVSERYPSALILGADQVMEMEGETLDKAPDRDAALKRIEAMRGKTHELHSGLAAVRGGELVWTHQQTSSLTVREFSDDFLKYYMSAAGNELTASVGAYAFEGVGAQLFDKIEGDFFAILGLPLLPVLNFLREEGVTDS